MMSDSSDDDRVYDHQIRDDDDDSEEEILASEDDEDDDDDDEYYDDRFSRFQIERKKDEMASDLEDDDDGDDGISDMKAWGKDKKSYYHTDYIDKDYRSQKQRDQDLAKYEEEEALQIQKRLLESISDQDLGIDLLLENIGQKSAKVPSIVEQDKSIERTTGALPVGLTDAQKAAIIEQESPELKLLKMDFEQYMNEIKSKLEPLLLALDQSIAQNPALCMLKLRLLLLTNYLAHISLYSSMKCSSDRQIVKDHPIIKRLFTYKKLIKQLDDWIETNAEFSRQIEFTLQSIRNKHQIRFVEANETTTDTVQQEQLDQDIDVESISSQNMDDDDNEGIDDMEEKRAITYEMEKNKGLTPKRKREQRNPRVKYRKKYEKAVIRRKGQVRQPRKELHKYGGEVTGINVRSVKSVKFK